MKAKTQTFGEIGVGFLFSRQADIKANSLITVFKSTSTSCLHNSRTAPSTNMQLVIAIRLAKVVMGYKSAKLAGLLIKVAVIESAFSLKLLFRSLGFCCSFLRFSLTNKAR